MREFGDRWMAEGEIENIRQWESKNTLDSTLSNNYGSCLEFFVQNELVYASSWTSYGNPREYTLFPSLGHPSGKQVLLETLLDGRIRRNRTVKLHELPK